MIHESSIELSGRNLKFETGKLAQQASGSVVVRFGDTVLIATATVSEKIRKDIDYFPLVVDYEEKMYAVGKIPGGFFKREGRPTEKAILTSRLIDRPIRPLFPDGFKNDVQIVVTPLSVDESNPPDVIAIIAASAAISISEIPFQGPIGAVRVARIDGKFIAYPTNEEMEKSDLDLVFAGDREEISMIEAKGDEIPEAVVIDAIKFGHKYINQVIDFQEEFKKKAGVPVMQFKVTMPDEKLEAYVVKEATGKIKEALYITNNEKQKDRLAVIENELVEKIKDGPDEHLKTVIKEKVSDLYAIMKSIEKKLVRHMIINEDKRPDGRKMDEVRPVTCEIGILPRAHGSAVFTRGMTQALTVVTLGAKGDAQIIDGLDAEKSEKCFMHHYNMPAYSVGEVRPLRGPGRREIGHGALAEKALLPVIPPEEEFPYTIRLVSEILGSNGSSSMASTCGSSLALMDAGAPIKAAVSGIAMGLVTEGKKFKILTDLQGLEDFLGDMDFKIAGSARGITAIQLDTKIKGLSMEIVEKTFAQAKTGRDFILNKMLEAISSPRKDLSEFAPRVISFSINTEKIGMVIGPGGKNIKKIIEDTKCQIDIEDDGRVFITSVDAAMAREAKARIDEIAMDAEIGKVYHGEVVKIMNFGAFVEILPGKDGMVHISKLANRRVNKVEDVVSVGDKVDVRVTEIDAQGRINLTMVI
ncbi:MAG: polyribonucleotide nucleotidyltransferase [Candidatus Saganbacteria bacterium]|nr:polyribonucleotide nucleotidyltransferase [Candidatus Saganbacteria bacterium]